MPVAAIARIQAAHREPLQRGGLGLRHGDDSPRHRTYRQRTIDQQQRVDRAVHLFPPLLILPPTCGIAGTARIPLHARSDGGGHLQSPVFPYDDGSVVHIRRRTQESNFAGGQSDFAADQIVIRLLSHSLDQIVPFQVLCGFAALMIDEVTQRLLLAAAFYGSAQNEVLFRQFGNQVPVLPVQCKGGRFS